MPSSYDEKVGGIVIGIDTSGSIGTEELTQFLSEVKSICDEVSPEKIDVLYWDTHVASRETYQGSELSNLVESTKPAGGGGTRLSRRGPGQRPARRLRRRQDERGCLGARDRLRHIRGTARAYEK